MSTEVPKEPITVEATVNAPMETVWKAWTEPEHITQWAFASDDWHAPKADNDVRVGGTFSTTMAAKDGSTSFEFGGTYTVVEENAKLEYSMGDGRTVQITFETLPDNGGVHIVESFDTEDVNSAEQQREGWQAIMNNFKKHAESLV